MLMGFSSLSFTPATIGLMGYWDGFLEDSVTVSTERLYIVRFRCYRTTYCLVFDVGFSTGIQDL